LDIANNQFALLYDMYSHFLSEYYSKEDEPLLSRSEFLNLAPLAIINCSKQSELLKTGTVDTRTLQEKNVICSKISIVIRRTAGNDFSHYYKCIPLDNEGSSKRN